MSDVLYLVLGWLFGLFSPLIYDRIKKKYQQEEIKRGLLTELKETEFKVVGAVYLLSRRLGLYNRELLEWLRPNVKSYSGAHYKDYILKAIESHLDLTDEQLAALSQYDKDEGKEGLSLKKYTLPFLDSMIGSLSVFDAEFQNKAFEIRAQVNLLNEEIDQTRFYFRMTFDSNLTPENHSVVTQNLNRCYENVLGASRRLADRISNLSSLS